MSEQVNNLLNTAKMKYEMKEYSEAFIFAESFLMNKANNAEAMYIAGISSFAAPKTIAYYAMNDCFILENGNYYDSVKNGQTFNFLNPYAKEYFLQIVKTKDIKFIDKALTYLCNLPVTTADLKGYRWESGLIDKQKTIRTEEREITGGAKIFVKLVQKAVGARPISGWFDLKYKDFMLPLFDEIKNQNLTAELQSAYENIFNSINGKISAKEYTWLLKILRMQCKKS